MVIMWHGLDFGGLGLTRAMEVVLTGATGIS